VPPPCIAEHAAAFDQLVLHAAQEKLEHDPGECKDERAVRLLQDRLRHGGFGLTPALTTSPAAYLGSLAAVHSLPVFAAYCDADTPLPSTFALHGWIDSSMQQLKQACPEAAQHLPSSASSFFAHYTNASPSVSSALQTTLSMQAASYSYDASLSTAKANRKQHGCAELAHLRAISAPRAWTWKTIIPTEFALKLTDNEYRIAARLNLGLKPMEPSAMRALPTQCHLCKKHCDFATDSWHFLSCPKLMGADGELTLRHNAVVDALYRAVLTLGGQAAREPVGLHFEDNRRPDIQIVFPGKHVLTDVTVAHPLAPGYTRTSVQKPSLHAQRRKRFRYAATAAHHHAQLLIFLCISRGGFHTTVQI
jgi:hypothetical protein